jgi:uncharacterized membrane protein
MKFVAALIALVVGVSLFAPATSSAQYGYSSGSSSYGTRSYGTGSYGTRSYGSSYRGGGSMSYGNYNGSFPVYLPFLLNDDSDLNFGEKAGGVVLLIVLLLTVALIGYFAWAMWRDW